jgi:hypothetical protein
MDETRIGNRYTYSGGALDYTRMLQEHPKNSTKDAHDRTASPSACAGQSNTGHSCNPCQFSASHLISGQPAHASPDEETPASF